MERLGKWYVFSIKPKPDQQFSKNTNILVKNVMPYQLPLCHFFLFGRATQMLDHSLRGSILAA